MYLILYLEMVRGDFLWVPVCATLVAYFLCIGVCIKRRYSSLLYRLLEMRASLAPLDLLYCFCDFQ